MKIGIGFGLKNLDGPRPETPPPPPPVTQADLTFLPLYGQSQSLGSDTNGGSTVSSTSGTHLMFAAGVRVHMDQLASGANENAPIAPEGMASLVPLTETYNPPIGSQFGETLASGIGARIAHRCLFATTGRGAYTAEKLARDGDGVYVDTNHYMNTYATVLNAWDRADEQNWSFAIPAFLWKQGEADAAGNTPPAAWKASVTQIRDDLRRDAQAAAHVDGAAIPLVLDQLAFRQDGRSYGAIAVAAIDLHRAGDAVCVGPMYDAEFTDSGDVHLSSNGYREHGERWGVVLDKIMADETWHPCHITQVSRSGTVITLSVHVPEAPLVIDSTTFAARNFADDGFSYSGAGILGVAITDDGTGSNTATIEITLDAAAPGTLHYAYENAALNVRNEVGGHIRDSAPETTLNSGRPLWNWLCTDEWEIL